MTRPAPGARSEPQEWPSAAALSDTALRQPPNGRAPAPRLHAEWPPGLHNSPRQRTAMENAEAIIFLEFGNPNGSRLSMAKTMVRVGPDSPAARARYGTIAGYIDDRGLDLDGALAFVEFMLAEENKRHAKSSRIWGRSKLNHLLRDSLFELVLIGRWLRLRARRGRAVNFHDIIDSAATPAWRPGLRVTRAVAAAE